MSVKTNTSGSSRLQLKEPCGESLSKNPQVMRISLTMVALPFHSFQVRGSLIHLARHEPQKCLMGQVKSINVNCGSQAISVVLSLSGNKEGGEGTEAVDTYLGKGSQR